MNPIVAVTKQFRLIAVLALLISVGAAQAQQLPKVNVPCVQCNWTRRIISLL